MIFQANFNAHFLGDKQGHLTNCPHVPEGDKRGHPPVRGVPRLSAGVDVSPLVPMPRFSCWGGVAERGVPFSLPKKSGEGCSW